MQMEDFSQFHVCVRVRVCVCVCVFVCLCAISLNFAHQIFENTLMSIQLHLSLYERVDF